MKIAIFGAASAMAVETARRLAGKDAEFFLVARSDDRLSAIKADLETRGAKVVGMARADLADCAIHERLVSDCAQSLGKMDLALLAWGSLPDQDACQNSAELARREIENNFLSMVSLLTGLANVMEQAGHGTLAVISSVAGDRGRQSNYVYGCAKGGLTIFLQGLRNRLYKAGVKVLTIKPGFVDTPMTADFRKGALFVKPEVVAEGICRAIAKGRDVAYLPWFWLPIMLIIRHIPEFIFKRLKL